MSDEVERLRMGADFRQRMRRRRIAGMLTGAVASAALIITLLGALFLPQWGIAVLLVAAFSALMWFGADRGCMTERLAERVERWLSGPPR